MSRRGRKKLTEENFFFVTTTIVNFAKVFADELCCDALINNIKHYQKKYEFVILAYVIMPTHFHWIVKTDNSKGIISDIMRDIKKYSAWDILEIIEKKEKQEVLNIFTANAEEYPTHKRKLWMHRFDDEVIRNNKMFWVKLKYIHNNPVKAGIVSKAEEYKYSSARNYINNDHSVIFVDIEYAGVEIT